MNSVMDWEQKLFSDSSGNPLLLYMQTPAAVNAAGLTNAATGSAPALSVWGRDANIALQLSSKGTSLVNVGDFGTATASAGAATLNAQRGVITTEGLTLASLLTYTLTLTNNKITASSVVQVTLQNGTNSQGIPMLLSVAPSAGSVVISIINLAAILALNGTLKVSFVIL